MKYSQMVGKTKKEISSEEESINAQLLTRGGFIHKELAGAYDLLPLGYIVAQKIVGIIREEMNAIGGQELMMTALQNAQPWKDTNRWNDDVYDIWFRTKLKNGTEIGLATTHEEPLGIFMRDQIQSYRDLPKYVYQFQTKFRNEMRAKSGLLRGREFIMKDLYSFNTTMEELDAFYEKAKEAYIRIFNRAGIGDKTYLTFASGGTYCKYSHEFQTVSDVGEDTIYLDEEKGIALNKEVYNDEVIKDLGLDKSKLKELKGIEVGNIFKQGTRFSIPLNLKYVDEQGKQQYVIMGAYGIGVQRMMATVVETYHDEKGILWPEAIAPYKIHLVGLNLEKEEINTKAENIYRELLSKGYEVLFDDRKDLNAGQKFSDADLIGCPYRVVVSAKTGEQIEVKKRTEKDSNLVTLAELIKQLG
jgi:prolyl-tRNA synthetase